MPNTTTQSLLITPIELAELQQNDAVTVLDVRWRLDRPDGRPEYLAGHIPGAVYVDVDTQLAHHGALTDGRHPIPPAEQLQEAARSWGVRKGRTVVVYDDLKNLSSARAWWLLSHSGVEDVRVLDGSLRGWTAAGYPLDEGSVEAEPGDIELSYDALPVLTIDEAAEFPMRGVLLDVRAGERYRGEVEPIDPRAGHIPGAISAPTTDSVDEAGRLRPRAELRQSFLELGVDPDRPVATYCGSGITAAHAAFALTAAGFDPVVYAGSWSQWSNHLDRPIAVGADPR
ncbi:MAG TPA: sulfurtransferase [Pseudolysinimonas sp.]|nr:sulfurtransferase [Pseudolysinimonas sp.]